MPALTGKLTLNVFDRELLVLALGFYTRLPVPQAEDYSRLPQASLLLPLVGWIVGGLVGLCFYLSGLIWTQSTAVVVSLVFGIFLTGAFHEDGFADVCDGFGGGYDKQRILEIMKDSRIGAYGALGIVLLIALKMSALASLPKLALPLILLAGHSISRWQPLLMMYRYDYARGDTSKSSAAMYKPPVKGMLMAGVIALSPMTLLPIIFMMAIPLVLLATWILGRYFFNHIGGYTGDCLGATQQVAEVVFYLSVSALWTFI